MSRKVVLSWLSVPVLVFLGIVVWMNLTPGWFQISCCDNVEYFSERDFGCIQYCKNNNISVLNQFKLLLSNLDFYKQSK